MKKLIIFLIAVTLISCDKETPVKDKETLSDNELEQLLVKDPDFSSFIDLKRNSFNEFKIRLSNLDNVTNSRLKSIFNNYKSADDFIEKGTAEELKFYIKTLSLDNKSVPSIKKVFNKLDNYNYSRNHFFITLASSISSKDSTSTVLKSTQPKDCEAYSFNIYVQVLNRLLGMGQSIDAADSGATIASSWAYVGCVYGSSK